MLLLKHFKNLFEDKVRRGCENFDNLEKLT